jgi:hypothetical protein
MVINSRNRPATFLDVAEQSVGLVGKGNPANAMMTFAVLICVVWACIVYGYA